MNNKKKGRLYYALFLLCLVISLACSGLIMAKILSETFWFLSIFAVAAGSTLYNLRNAAIAKSETEARRERRAIRKKQQRNRYL